MIKSGRTSIKTIERSDLFLLTVFAILVLTGYFLFDIIFQNPESTLFRCEVIFYLLVGAAVASFFPKDGIKGQAVRMIILTITVLCWTTNFHIIRSLASYFPAVDYWIVDVATFAGILFGLEYFRDSYKNKELPFVVWFFIMGLFVLFLSIGMFFFSDSDRNGINNYKEIYFGLNPYVANDKDGLIDGCFIKWREQGYEYSRENLPTDVDKDGCFDQIENLNGSKTATDYSVIPSDIQIIPSDPKFASVSNKIWEIKVLSGGLLPSSYEFQIFSWQNFRFNHENDSRNFLVSMTLINPTGPPQIVSFLCARFDSQTGAGLGERIKCSLDFPKTKEIVDFMLKNNMRRSYALWQVELKGSPKLFPIDSDLNTFQIILNLPV